MWAILVGKKKNNEKIRKSTKSASFSNFDLFLEVDRLPAQLSVCVCVCVCVCVKLR